MLKAPLIIGNDIRELLDSTNDENKAIFDILSNKEVIAVNQDPLGRQARRVWSDSSDLLQLSNEDRLIASKCSSTSTVQDFFP